MQKLIIPAAVCEQIAQAGPDTAGSVLMYIFVMRCMGGDPTPYVKEDSEAVRLIWSVVVKEYERIDKNTNRMRTVRALCETTPSPSPKEKKSPHLLKEKDTSSSTPSLDQASLDRLFDRFWAVYPRKVAKKLARTKFHAILKQSKDPEKLTEEILAAVQEQEKKLEWSKDRIQYVPHPTTWLNQCRWEDEVIAIGPERRNAPRKADNWIGTPSDRLEEVF